MCGRTSGRAAADMKSGPIGSRVTVAEGGGVVEYIEVFVESGPTRIGSGPSSGDGGSGGNGSGKGSPYNHPPFR